MNGRNLLLLLTGDEPPPRLREAIGRHAPPPARVHVVAPALVGPLDWLASAEDDAHRQAEVRALDAEWTLADSASRSDRAARLWTEAPLSGGRRPLCRMARTSFRFDHVWQPPKNSRIVSRSMEDSAALQKMPKFTREHAEQMAGFLRANAIHWRLRRHDRFIPLDLQLAEHHVTIQGRLDNALLRRFGEPSGEPEFDVEAGTELSLYVPVISQRKELLVNFSTRDEEGHALPILTRMEGSQVSAAYVLAALGNGADPTSTTTLDVSETLAASVVLTLIAYVNPYSLVQRISSWAREQHFDFRRGHPLDPPSLEAWIYREGELFKRRAGDALVEQLEPLLRRQHGGGAETTIPDQVRGGGIDHFPWLSSFVLHSVRDLLRLTVEFAPAWRTGNDGPPTRDELMNEPEALATLAADYARVGLDRVEALVRAQNPNDTSAQEELFRLLPRWTVYAVTTARVGLPFLLKVHEVLPLGSGMSKPEEWLRAMFTRIEVPVAFKDAASLHIEVEMKDPELQLGSGFSVVHDASTDPTREDVGSYFGTMHRASDQIVQLYSSRRDGESPDHDASPGRLSLRIPIRLTFTVWAGYWLTAVALVIAATYVFLEWWHRTFDNHQPDRAALATVMALSLTVSLWLTAVSPRRPLVHRKLILPRMIFITAITVVLAAPGIWLGHAAYIRWHRTHKKTADYLPVSGFGAERRTSPSRTPFEDLPSPSLRRRPAR